MKKTYIFKQIHIV